MTFERRYPRPQLPGHGSYEPHPDKQANKQALAAYAQEGLLDTFSSLINFSFNVTLIETT